MAKHLSSTSDSDSDGTQADSGSEPEPPTLPDPSKPTLSTYEKQRQSRIAENNKRLEALGLRKMASSVMGSSQKAKKGDPKGKRKVGEDDDDVKDDDYAPALDDGGDDDDLSVDDEEDDQDFEVSGYGKRKGKRKASKPKKKPQTKKLLNKLDYVDDDDALAKALMLSLHDSARVSGTVSSGPSKNETGVGRNSIVEKTQENPRTLKRKKTFTSRVKMTEDELLMHFFQFDEAGKGSITVRDIAKLADAHDFTWTDKQLADMIHCFDSDGDGKLSLDDFSKIVRRCNMIQGSESS